MLLNSKGGTPLQAVESTWNPGLANQLGGQQGQRNRHRRQQRGGWAQPEQPGVGHVGAVRV